MLKRCKGVSLWVKGLKASIELSYFFERAIAPIAVSNLPWSCCRPDGGFGSPLVSSAGASILRQIGLWSKSEGKTWMVQGLGLIPGSTIRFDDKTNPSIWLFDSGRTPSTTWRFSNLNNLSLFSVNPSKPSSWKILDDSSHEWNANSAFLQDDRALKSITVTLAKWNLWPILFNNGTFVL